MAKYDFDYIKLFVQNLGYELINKEYIKCMNKLTLKDEENFYYYISFICLQNKHTPRKFDKQNPYTIQNIKLWCTINNKPFELISYKYEGNKEKLKWQCLEKDCSEIFEKSWDCIHRGDKCPYCVGQQVGLSNCLATKNPELVSEWHPTRNNKLTPYNVTCGSTKKVWWKCNDCGYEWKAEIGNRNNNRNCPECSKSKGEKRIKEWLRKNNLNYVSQYEFSDLMSDLNNPLRFDVGILDDKNSLELLIEFDGLQHYKWIKGWYTKKQFITLQYHDKLKNQYCKRNNIKLIRIPWCQENKIEEILNRKVIKNKIKLEQGGY